MYDDNQEESDRDKAFFEAMFECILAGFPKGIQGAFNPDKQN